MDKIRSLIILKIDFQVGWKNCAGHTWPIDSHYFEANPRVFLRRVPSRSMREGLADRSAESRSPMRKLIFRLNKSKRAMEGYDTVVEGRARKISILLRARRSQGRNRYIIEQSPMHRFLWTRGRGAVMQRGKKGTWPAREKKRVVVVCPRPLEEARGRKRGAFVGT